MELNTRRKAVKDFFSDIESEIQPDIHETRGGLSFEKGKKLVLLVEVEDKDLTGYLFRWLYSKDSDGKELIPFGCKLNQISWEPFISKDMLREKFMEFIASIE